MSQLVKTLQKVVEYNTVGTLVATYKTLFVIRTALITAISHIQFLSMDEKDKTKSTSTLHTCDPTIPRNTHTPSNSNKKIKIHRKFTHVVHPKCA